MSTCPQMCQLQAVCPGDHVHRPFGRTVQRDGSHKYGTADEAAYPRKLCLQIVSIVQMALQYFPEKETLETAALSTNIRASIGSQVQPRGRRVKPLLSEFRKVVTLTLREPPVLDPKHCLVSACQGAPPGSKLVAKKTEVGVEEVTNYSFGIYREPMLWIEEAKVLRHPFDCFHALPDEWIRVIFSLLTRNPAAIARERARLLKLWISWASDLSAEEKLLHEQMEPGVAAVLLPKRILLLKKIPLSIGWPNMGLFDEIQNGSMLVGMQPPSGVFALEPRPAAYSTDELDDASKFLRPAILGKIKSNVGDDGQSQLSGMTFEEAANKGWMDGPLTVHEVQSRYGSSWIPVRRFGIWQSSGDKVKLRPIDDYAENRVNGAFAYSDKLELKTLDQIIWTAVAIVRSCSEGRVTLRPSDGEVLDAQVVDCILKSDSWKPMISVLDLSSALPYTLHAEGILWLP